MNTESKPLATFTSASGTVHRVDFASKPEPLDWALIVIDHDSPWPAEVIAVAGSRETVEAARGRAGKANLYMGTSFTCEIVPANVEA